MAAQALSGQPLRRPARLEALIRIVSGGHRLAEQIALDHRAALLPQLFELGRILDAFSKGDHAKIVRKTNHRTDNRAAILPVLKVIDETAVNLLILSNGKVRK